MRDLATFLVWASLIPLCFWSAHVGVLLWIWSALLAPSELLYGFMSAVPFNKLTAVLTIGVLLLRGEWRGFYLDATLVILLLFGFAATISAAQALSPGMVNDELHSRFVKVLVLAVVVTGVMSSRWRMHAAVIAICLAFGFDMVTAAIRFLITAGGAKITGRASVGDNNHLAVAFLVTLPLIRYALRQSTVPLVRLGFAGLLVMGTLGVVGTYSRGGFVGLIILIAWTIARSRRRILNGLLVALVAGAAYTMMPASYFHRVESIKSAEQDSSFMNRVNAWKISTLIALDHPFFGGGFNATQHTDVWMHYGPFADAMDIVETPPSGTAAFAAHSIYFQVLGDLGFVGLGLFLLMLGHSVLLAGRLRRRCRGDPSRAWASDLAEALQASLVVYCVSGATLSLAYFEPLYLIIALISRLDRSLRTVAVPVAQRPAVRGWSDLRAVSMPAAGWRNRAVGPARSAGS